MTGQGQKDNAAILIKIAALLCEIVHYWPKMDSFAVKLHFRYPDR